MAAIRVMLGHLLADMPRDTDDRVHARWLVQQAEAWLGRAAEAQDTLERGPAKAPLRPFMKPVRARIAPVNRDQNNGGDEG